MASDAPDAFKDLGLEFLWSYVAANQVAGASAELILHGLKETPEYSAPFPGSEELTYKVWDCEECGGPCEPPDVVCPECQAWDAPED
jgi:rubrerythrin